MWKTGFLVEVHALVSPLSFHPLLFLEPTCLPPCFTVLSTLILHLGLSENGIHWERPFPATPRREEPFLLCVTSTCFPLSLHSTYMSVFFFHHGHLSLQCKLCEQKNFLSCYLFDVQKALVPSQGLNAFCPVKL